MKILFGLRKKRKFLLILKEDKLKFDFWEEGVIEIFVLLVEKFLIEEYKFVYVVKDEISNI